MNKQKKEIRLTFRVTPAQHEQIVAAAQEADMTPAAYARAATLHQQVKVFPGLPEITHELKGIGRNLNHLTVLAHEGKIRTAYLDETAEALRHLYDPLYIISHEAWH
ncbi:MAG: hypothetical protein IJ617_03760 [Oscillospiraceae bacterium]|nr:hypothetical protein [Oscillospiraceae bacterium]